MRTKRTILIIGTILMMLIYVVLTKVSSSNFPNIDSNKSSIAEGNHTLRFDEFDPVPFKNAVSNSHIIFIGTLIDKPLTKNMILVHPFRVEELIKGVYFEKNIAVNLGDSLKEYFEVGKKYCVLLTITELVFYEEPFYDYTYTQAIEVFDDNTFKEYGIINDGALNNIYNKVDLLKDLIMSTGHNEKTFGVVNSVIRPYSKSTDLRTIINDSDYVAEVEIKDVDNVNLHVSVVKASIIKLYKGDISTSEIRVQMLPGVKSGDRCLILFNDIDGNQLYFVSSKLSQARAYSELYDKYYDLLLAK